MEADHVLAAVDKPEGAASRIVEDDDSFFEEALFPGREGASMLPVVRLGASMTR